MSLPYSIAVVGAGFSGTLTAVQLLRRAQRPLTVYLVERAPAKFARGVAYSYSSACHLLNVPAGNMSAFPDQPDHFLRWAKDQESSLIDPPWVTEVTPTSFLPRRAYGDYLRQVLDDAEYHAGSGVRLERILDEAVGLETKRKGIALHLGEGGTLRVDKAVLALGNFRPGNPVVADRSFYDSPRYHGDPWVPELLQKILPTSSCLLIGAGLTMIDWALTLSQAGYRGTIHAVSRRGLWPKAHARTSGVAFSLESDTRPPTIRGWLGQIRRFIRSNDGDWRAVIDALRPVSPALWQSLPRAEQRRFLRHLRPYWDCHRHRIAPFVAARVQTLVESGHLVRYVGRVNGYRETDAGVEVLIRKRGRTETSVVQADVVLNCSGSESDYRNLDSPLVRGILEQGIASPDPLLFGLNVGSDGALIALNGVASRSLYTLGPPQKGVLWETTAVPEIRQQAARLASLLLDRTGA